MVKPVLWVITAFLLALSHSVSAQTAVADDFRNTDSVSGYVITKDIKVARSKATDAPFDYTIKAGKVCINSEEEPDSYEFIAIDCVETITIGKDYITYCEPNQDPDATPKRYTKRALFNQSAKKISIYTVAPHSWKTDSVFNFVPRIKEYIQKVSIKPVVIKDKQAVLIESTRDKDTNTYMQHRTSMYYKTVYEITQYNTDNTTERYYWYNGAQLFKNNFDSNGEYLEDYADTMMIDENGYCFAKGAKETSTFLPCHEVTTEIGEYPNLAFVGWLSQTQVVIDDVLYNAVSK